MRGTVLHHSDGFGGAPDTAWLGWFAVWMVIGAAFGFGLIVFPASVLLVGLVGVLLHRRRGARSSAFGVVSGVGVVLLIVAWIQRQGPGTTCWHTATASGCEQHLNPIPWLIAGIILVVTGALVAWRTRG